MPIKTQHSMVMLRVHAMLWFDSYKYYNEILVQYFKSFFLYIGSSTIKNIFKSWFISN